MLCGLSLEKKNDSSDGREEKSERGVFILQKIKGDR